MKIGQLLPPPKDCMCSEVRKGAVYEIPCGGCEQRYIGETKRCLASRKKEHIRDCQRNDATKTALSKHVCETSHEVDWQNANVLEFENGYHKRVFLESFHINSKPNTMNDKRTVKFPPVYAALCNK